MIDTKTFVAKDSRLLDICYCLADAMTDVQVYTPGAHSGTCSTVYIVVKFDGASKTNYSTDERLYSVMVYVPKKEYSSLSSYIDRIKTAMLKLEPMFVSTGVMTPSYYDGTVEGHMVSIEYRCYVKRQGI